MESPFNFSNIPTDILNLIGLELEPNDLGSYFRLNRRFNSISKNDLFWKLKLDRDFSIFNGQPPFDRPDFTLLSSEEQEKYRNYFVKLNSRRGSSDDFSSITSLDEIFTSIEDEIFDSPTSSLNIRDKFKDPRIRYQRLTVIRWDYQEEDYYDNLIEKDSRYWELKKEIKLIKENYKNKEAKFLKRLKAAQHQLLISNFNPQYREVIRPFGPINDIPLEEILSGISHSGLIVGLRFTSNNMDLSDVPNYFYTVHELMDGSLSISRGKRCLPKNFIQFIRGLGWSVNKLLSHYTFPFPTHTI